MVRTSPTCASAWSSPTSAEAVKHVEFKVFFRTGQRRRRSRGCLRVPEGASLTRKQLDDYGLYVAKYGAKGLAWIRVDDWARGARA